MVIFHSYVKLPEGNSCLDQNLLVDHHRIAVSRNSCRPQSCLNFKTPWNRVWIRRMFPHLGKSKVSNLHTLSPFFKPYWLWIIQLSSGAEVKGRFHRDMGVVAAYLPWEQLLFEISRLVWTKTTMELMIFSGQCLQICELENIGKSPCLSMFNGKITYFYGHVPS